MRDSAWKYLGLISQLGLLIVVAMVMGAGIGVYLDRLVGTVLLFTLVFIFVGAASGLWSAYQLIEKTSSPKPSNPEKSDSDDQLG